MARSHRQKFANWCRLGGAPMIALGQLVGARLLPLFEAAGFVRAEFWGGDPTLPVTGKDIVMERRVGDEFHNVCFNFDKYRRPKFQVHLYRHVAEPPYGTIAQANIVKNAQYYYYFWGKSRWLPGRFWSTQASERVVDHLVGCMDQGLAYFDHGARGPNISRSVPPPPPPPRPAPTGEGR